VSPAETRFGGQRIAEEKNVSVALITGGSAGLGHALSVALADVGWTVVTDGRSTDRLARLPRERVVTVVGDITDAAHRARLAEEVERLGRLDLLVHNASTLGPLPLRPLRELPAAELAEVWRVNVGAPLALTQLLLSKLLASSGVLITVSSDAAVEHYENWGVYGASKAAADHLTITLAAEEGLLGYAVDPGDMRTQMQADAFPGEDISDRPLPETVVPKLLTLLRDRPPSGRYRAEDLEAGDLQPVTADA
jgi:NAD(P)-dependent dehydrogenase (short-subunit alcohol dehydrogenase family)